MSLGLSARALVEEMENLERDLRHTALVLVKAQQQAAGKLSTVISLQDDLWDALKESDQADEAAHTAAANVQAVIARMCQLHEDVPSVSGTNLTRRQQAVLASSPLILAGNLINKLRSMEKAGRL